MPAQHNNPSRHSSATFRPWRQRQFIAEWGRITTLPIRSVPNCFADLSSTCP